LIVKNPKNKDTIKYSPSKIKLSKLKPRKNKIVKNLIHPKKNNFSKKLSLLNI